MLNHVLVPLDGSPLAEEALQSATRLLDPHGKLTLISAVEMLQNWTHGLDRIIAYGEYQKLLDELLLEAKNYLDKVAAKLRDQGFEVDVVVEVGEAWRSILNTSTHRSIDAIVMTTHGRSGLSRWLLGSVTNKVLSASPYPVLIVPGQKHVHDVMKAAASDN